MDDHDEVSYHQPSQPSAAASGEYKTPHERLYVEGSIHKREIEHKVSDIISNNVVRC